MRTQEIDEGERRKEDGGRKERRGRNAPWHFPRKWPGDRAVPGGLTSLGSWTPFLQTPVSALLLPLDISGSPM